MIKPTLTEQEFDVLLAVMRKSTKTAAKEEKWRPSELALSLAKLPDEIRARFKVPKSRRT